MIINRFIHKTAALAMPLLMAIAGGVFVSCSETDTTDTEYDNWRNRNEAYFSDIYKQAKAQKEAGNKDWDIILSISQPIEKDNIEDAHIVVQKLDSVPGNYLKGHPEGSDSVRVHYKGYLMPTEAHPEGYNFDASWTGPYNPSTMIPSSFAVSTVVNGFSTALQHMSVGDRWRVYVPYTLGYEASGSSAIPGYSTLVFDLTLHSYTKKGHAFPPFQ